jgi:hypothetical protein
MNIQSEIEQIGSNIKKLFDNLMKHEGYKPEDANSEAFHISDNYKKNLNELANKFLT